MVTRDLMEPQTQGKTRMAEVASIIRVLRSMAVFFLTMDIHFTGKRHLLYNNNAMLTNSWCREIDWR